MKGSKTFQLFGILAIVTLVAAGAYGFMFWDIREKNTRISVLSNDIERLQNRKRELRSAQGVLSDTRAHRRELTRYFVQPDNVVGFIEFVERTASHGGVSATIKKVEAVGDTEQPGDRLVEPLEFTLTTTGSWSNTMQFLRLLESMPYPMTISNVQVVQQSDVSGGDEDSSSSSSWKGGFTFQVFKLVQ